MQHREDRIYAQADGRTAALANAWDEGWRARGFDRPDARNPYDGTKPNAARPEV